MSERHPNIVNAEQLSWIDVAAVRRQTSPGDHDRGHQFGARAKPLALPAGAVKLGCTLYELPPGLKSFPFHYHLGNEEAIYILDGSATLRIGDREVAVAAGDYIALPVGPAHSHQLINTSYAPVHYLCMSTTERPEVAIYPDSNKVGVFGANADPGGAPLRQYARLGETLAYYDGEDK